MVGGGETLTFASPFEPAKLNIGDYSDMKNVGGGRDGGSITLTSGVLMQQPVAYGAAASLANGGIEGFVRAAAVEQHMVEGDADQQRPPPAAEVSPKDS